jgi:Zn-dependent protease
MILTDPPPSQYDLHFRVFGFPVRVHPWFWVIALLFGIMGRERADPAETVIWVGVLFVSILVHELGHAFLQRRYGGHPKIVLYGMGGLAICDDCDRRPTPQILISLAGPLAGFLLAALVLVSIRIAGHQIEFRGFKGWIGYFIPAWKQFDAPLLNTLVLNLLWVNIFWGLINLLPIYPLDGGRISREVFTLGHPRQGIIQSLWLSTIAAAGVAVFGLMTMGSLFIAAFFGYLAYSSYQTLQAYQQHWQ